MFRLFHLGVLPSLVHVFWGFFLLGNDLTTFMWLIICSRVLSYIMHIVFILWDDNKELFISCGSIWGCHYYYSFPSYRLWIVSVIFLLQINRQWLYVFNLLMYTYYIMYLLTYVFSTFLFLRIYFICYWFFVIVKQP